MARDIVTTSQAVLITGSGGLIGSGLARNLLEQGRATVSGVDNDSRGRFFGREGSTAAQIRYLTRTYGDAYVHRWVDIGDKARLRTALDSLPATPSAIVHCAAQPSHDWAGAHPASDFEINAVGTLNLLDWARHNAPTATFVLLSSNKVYSSTDVNSLKICEYQSRLDVPISSEYWAGINEAFPVGRGSRSLYGTSKLAADLLVQEFGHYYGLRTVILRCGSMTGPHQSAVALHGFLAYIIRQVETKQPYHVNGYKGKQVRDNLHYSDAARAIMHVLENPPSAGSVFNLGGGRDNSCSIIEAIRTAASVTGKSPQIRFHDVPRRSDFQWWITDNSLFKTRYPSWKPTVPLKDMVEECVGHLRRKVAGN
jgi:CDP-paratose 2-epimerase